MKISIPKLALSVFLFISAQSCAQQLHSGIYEGLELAVSPDSKITGFFVESHDVSKCKIFFNGVIKKNGQAETISWSLNKTSSGSLKQQNNDIYITIADGQSYPGCGNVLSPDIETETGMPFSLLKSEKWLELVVINDNKVYLYTSPSENSPHHAYVLKDDVVAIDKYGKEWSLVTYINPEGGLKQSSGWIKNSQYKELAPPTTSEQR
jgi:hypothetical protein